MHDHREAAHSNAVNRVVQGRQMRGVIGFSQDEGNLVNMHDNAPYYSSHEVPPLRPGRLARAMAGPGLGLAVMLLMGLALLLGDGFGLDMPGLYTHDPGQIERTGLRAHVVVDPAGRVVLTEEFAIFPTPGDQPIERIALHVLAKHEQAHPIVTIPGHQVTPIAEFAGVLHGIAHPPTWQLNSHYMWRVSPPLPPGQMVQAKSVRKLTAPWQRAQDGGHKLATQLIAPAGLPPYGVRLAVDWPDGVAGQQRLVIDRQDHVMMRTNQPFVDAPSQQISPAVLTQSPQVELRAPASMGALPGSDISLADMLVWALIPCAALLAWFSMRLRHILRPSPPMPLDGSSMPSPTVAYCLRNRMEDPAMVLPIALAALADKGLVSITQKDAHYCIRVTREVTFANLGLPPEEEALLTAIHYGGGSPHGLGMRVPPTSETRKKQGIDWQSAPLRALQTRMMPKLFSIWPLGMWLPLLMALPLLLVMLVLVPWSNILGIALFFATGLTLAGNLPASALTKWRYLRDDIAMGEFKPDIAAMINAALLLASAGVVLGTIVAMIWQMLADSITPAMMAVLVLSVLLIWIAHACLSGPAYRLTEQGRQAEAMRLGLSVQPQGLAWQLARGDMPDDPLWAHLLPLLRRLEVTAALPDASVGRR